MKRKYEVRWYEYDPTRERSRKFFTKLGAIFFASYIEAYDHVKPKTYEYDPDTDQRRLLDE